MNWLYRIFRRRYGFRIKHPERLHHTPHNLRNLRGPHYIDWDALRKAAGVIS